MAAYDSPKGGVRKNRFFQFDNKSDRGMDTAAGRVFNEMERRALLGCRAGLATQEDTVVFKSLVCFLRKNLPADRPVSIRRTRVPYDVQGDCQRLAAGYRIRIDRELGEAHQIDVLLHEYGHTLAYEPEHGAAWGKAYARVYRAYLAWVEWFDRHSIILSTQQCAAAARASHRSGPNRQRQRRRRSA